MQVKPALGRQVNYKPAHEFAGTAFSRPLEEIKVQKNGYLKLLFQFQIFINYLGHSAFSQYTNYTEMNFRIAMI